MKTHAKLIFVLLLFLGAIGIVPSHAAKAPQTWTAELDAQVGSVLAQVGEACCRRIEQLVAALNQGKFLKLKIENSFYDPRLRRVFVAFNGDGFYTGKLLGKIPDGGWLVTGDGMLAYDLAVTNPVPEGSGVRFHLSGTGVIFLEKVVLEVAAQAAGVSGVPVVKEAACTMLHVVDGIDCGLVAKGINDLFSAFSLERMKDLGDKIIAGKKDSPELVKGVVAAVKSGKALDYLRLSLVHQSIGTAAGMAGATLGALLGGVLIPGPVGSVGGLIVGSCALASLTKGVVYKFSVEMPIDLGLRRVVQAGLDSRGVGGAAPSVQETGAAGAAMVLERVREEFKHKQFKAFDYTLERIDSLKPEQRPFLVPVLKQIQSDLIRKVTVDADWFFAKKYYQMKTRVETWGMLGQIPFTADVPADGQPSRQPRRN